MKRLFWLSAALVAAGACAEMRPDNRYRVWLPALIRGQEY